MQFRKDVASGDVNWPASGFDEDRLALLEAFVAVAQSLSFVNAASRLEKTPSSISRKITRLEKNLGVRLLYRTTRQVSLTEAGRLYLNHCRKLMQGLAEADAEIMSLNATPRGILRVTAPEALGRSHLMDAITAFMAQNPGIEIDLNLADRYVDMIAEEFDVAVRIGTLQESRLIARKLVENHRILIATPEYLKQYGVPTKPSDLTQQKCLIYSRYKNFGAEWGFDNGDRHENISVQGPFRSDCSAAVLSAVLRDLGIGVVARYMCHGELASGKVIQLLPEWVVTPEASIYAVFASSQHLASKSRAFVDFLVGYFRTSEWKEIF